ncbi:hypothetical protein PVAP13_5NG534986 [Panicum virgatum]|uniref:Uncharacterized protein n=1 Tax=Panicum virgatum TaxID=38727 RepID=A0A8T0S3L7_PANVG|nr:hypothetical protein PVAP13_5NG534986 [Panicum virgatum]
MMMWSSNPRDRRLHLVHLSLPIHLRCDACGFRHDNVIPLTGHKEDLTEGERYIGAPKGLPLLLEGFFFVKSF